MEDVLSSPQQMVISGVVNSRLIRPPGSIEGYVSCTCHENDSILLITILLLEFAVRE